MFWLHAAERTRRATVAEPRNAKLRRVKGRARSETFVMSSVLGLRRLPLRPVPRLNPPESIPWWPKAQTNNGCAVQQARPRERAAGARPSPGRWAPERRLQRLVHSGEWIARIQIVARRWPDATPRTRRWRRDGAGSPTSMADRATRWAIRAKGGRFSAGDFRRWGLPKTLPMTRHGRRRPPASPLRAYCSSPSSIRWSGSGDRRI